MQGSYQKRASLRALVGITHILLCLATGLSFADQSATGEWTQWRGPDRNAIVKGTAWPDSLDETVLKLMWRQDIGEGYPGPIVSTDRVFTVETLDRQREIVRAFDRVSGKELWHKGWDGSMKVPFFAAKNGSWVRSTPAYDGECLYVGGMRDVLVCLDAADGEIRWSVDFMERHDSPLPQFGFVCSPLVFGDAVYVQAAAGVLKLDPKTGKTIWRTLKDSGGMFGGAFSSPVMETICGREQLVVQTRSLLAGIDPEDGKVLWRQKVEAFRGMNILTPTVIGNALFTSCYGGNSLLYELKNEGDGFVISETWRNKKSQGYMSSPVAVDGKIYFHRRDQRLSCFDPTTQTFPWQSGKLGLYCSLVSNEKAILALNQKGELFLIECTPDRFNLVDRRKVASQDTWGHIAVAGDQLFIRELKAIAAYRWKLGE